MIYQFGQSIGFVIVSNGLYNFCLINYVFCYHFTQWMKLSKSAVREPSELSQWLCYDDSTINIFVIIIIIILFIVANALHSSIGQFTSVSGLRYPLSGLRYPVSVLRPECEKLQMAITQQRIIRWTSCLVLGWFFF